MSPFFMAFTAFVAALPVTFSSSTKTTGLPSSSSRRFATGRRDSPSFGPFLTLPRCEQRITLPPSPDSFLMVGSAARMRVSSVITPLFSGTLKSQRTRMRLPLIWMSSKVFLFSISILPMSSDYLRFLMRFRPISGQNGIFCLIFGLIYYTSFPLLFQPEKHENNMKIDRPDKRKSLTLPSRLTAAAKPAKIEAGKGSEAGCAPSSCRK